jgi:hypothetical protein
VSYDFDKDGEKFSNEEILEYHNLGYTHLHEINQAVADEAKMVEQERAGNYSVSPGLVRRQQEAERVQTLKDRRSILTRLSGGSESLAARASLIQRFVDMESGTLQCATCKEWISEESDVYMTTTGCAHLCRECSIRIGGRLRPLVADSPLLSSWAFGIIGTLPAVFTYNFKCEECDQPFERENLPPEDVVARSGIVCRKCSKKTSASGAPRIMLSRPDTEVEEMARRIGFAVDFALNTPDGPPVSRNLPL